MGNLWQANTTQAGKVKHAGLIAWFGAFNTAQVLSIKRRDWKHTANSSWATV